MKRYWAKVLPETNAESLAAPENPGTGAAAPDLRPARTLSMLVNSIALILGKVATMGFGFLSWLLAARLFAPQEVGLASGAVSAMILVTQIALLGVSSAIIALFPAHQNQPARLLNTAMTIVSAAALVTGGLFLILATTAFQELRAVASIPLFALLFLVMSVLGTVGVVLDQTSTALRRGDQMFARGVVAGLVTLAGISVLPSLLNVQGSVAIFSAWVAGGLSACLLGSVQLWRSLSGYLYRPQVEPSLARSLLGVGLPNYALTVTERAPALIIPIVVTELLSPETTAYWYVIWMMAWVVFIVPVQVGINLFAEAARHPDRIGRVVRQGLRSSLALGIAGAVGMAAMAHVALSLLGRSYAEAGVTPLRILLVGVLPLCFIYAYFAVCRSRGKLREATLTGALNGLLSVIGTALAGLAYGLNGMAAAWVAAQFLTGVWALLRLRSIVGLGGPQSAQGLSDLVSAPAVLSTRDPVA